MSIKPEIVKAPKPNKEVRANDKLLTLDDIEKKMIKLATSETDDLVKMMINEKKIAMLEKVANLKIHRLQLKQLEIEAIPVETKPIQVEFIDATTPNCQNRVQQMEELVEKQLGMEPAKS